METNLPLMEKTSDTTSLKSVQLGSETKFVKATTKLVENFTPPLVFNDGDASVVKGNFICPLFPQSYSEELRCMLTTLLQQEIRVLELSR